MLLRYSSKYDGSGNIFSDGEDETWNPIEYKVCNLSSMAFYIFEFAYASYTLYRLLWKNDKSKSLISATIMLLISSLCLTIFFALENDGYFDIPVWSIAQKLIFVIIY